MINEEEFTKFDIEEKIKLFQNGIEILKQSIKTKKEIKHNEKLMWKALEEIRKKISEEYAIKEKAHQNTSDIKEKYSFLIKTIYEYNILLNEYNKFAKNKLKTFGDYFRSIGVKTKKSSIKSCFNY